MSEKELVDKLKQSIGPQHVLDAGSQQAGRIYVQIDNIRLKDAISFLKTHGFTHLLAISGLEIEGRIELLYHLGKNGLLLTLRVKLPPNKLVTPSIIDIIPGADPYEREVHDLFGVNFEGHSKLARLILPDDWPKGDYPLRKDRPAKEKERSEQEDI
ncbi:MAG: NADH-quinone oxidoreductase subunit C [Candidatus Bathycorpusculaceae bacterium]